MKISKDMKVSSIVKSFRTNYDLNIEIYVAQDKPSEITLAEIIPTDHKKKSSFFDIRGNSKISDIEDMFFDTFGIDVQIKNKDGSITDSDLTIYKVINNVKGYSLTDKNKEDNIKTKSLEVKDTKKKKKKDSDINKDDATNNEKENTKIDNEIETTLNESQVETRIKEIDNLYIIYQKKEKYKDMIKLLSSMEEAEISSYSSEKLLLHIDSIMNKAHGIAHLSVKKRKFFLLISSIIVLTLFITGVTLFVLDTVNNRNIAKEIKTILNDIEVLKKEQIAFVSEGSSIKASLVKVTIEEKITQINNMKLRMIEQNINIFLAISFIGILILSIMLIKLNKYTVTSTRFFK